MNFAWRKWKLGLAVSVVLALLVAGSGLAAGMHWQAFISVLCMALLTHLGAFLKDHPVDAVSFDDGKQDDSMKKIVPLILFGLLALTLSGCLLRKKQVVTTNPLTGISTTNTVTVVNEVNLAIDCAGFELAATPLLTRALSSDPSARPIVVDVRTAVDGLQNGVNTNTMAIIVGYAGKNAALDKQLGGLVQKVSDLRGQLLVKYGSSNALVIEQAVAASVVRVCDASLAAVPTAP